jgi:ATP-dependent Clp protease protease subunit
VLVVALSMALSPAVSAAPQIVAPERAAPSDGGSRPARGADELAQSLKRLQLEKEAAEARLSLERLEREAELAGLRAQIEKLQAETELAAARRERHAEQLEAQLAGTQAESRRLATERQKLEEQLAVARASVALEMERLQSGVKRAEAERNLQAVVDGTSPYVDQPYRDGMLEISNRRIALNGVITLATAEHVAERLSFFNNKSERYPVFIVIDYSPGGSVMAGHGILKAIEASRAPVHVLVKSFAASMAAVITSLAPHSYIYPNAILMHHQISSGIGGNLTMQREHVSRVQEWSRRLHGPLCKRLGTSLEQFVREMYRHDSKGDWSEFGDSAARLGWVGHVVKGVRERGITQLSSPSAADAVPDVLGQRRDPQGRSYVELPRLQPFDLWFLHDPGNFYR